MARAPSSSTSPGCSRNARLRRRTRDSPMDLAQVRERLARTALLHGAPGEVIEACASLGSRSALSPGETLIHAGSRTGSLHVLLEGRVEVRLPGVGGPAVVAELAQGEVLGEIQLVTGQAATTDVVAVEPCTVLELDGELLRAIPEAFASFEERLSQLAGQRLRKLAFRSVVHDLLRGVTPTLVDEFIAGATGVALPRGERLFSQGDAADA